MDENFAYLPQWDDSDSASYEQAVGVVQRLTAIKEPIVNNQSVDVRNATAVSAVAPRENLATAAMLSPISYKVVTGNRVANHVSRNNELNYSQQIHDMNHNKTTHKSVLHPTSELMILL